VADRFGCALWVVLTLPARAETTWDFTGQDETPLSPNDDAHHPKCRKGYPYRFSPGDPAGGPGQLLRRQGGGSQGHSGQRATLRSNAGWPLRYAPLERTGYAPPGAALPPEFCQRFLHKYGLAQVGLSLCYQHGLHRLYCDLAFHPYGSRALKGERESEGEGRR
jgi:hypothetical protein